MNFMADFRFFYNSTVNASVENTGVSQASFSNTLADVSKSNKIAISYKLNEFKFFVNGAQIGVTDTSGDTPIDLSKLSFDNSGGGGNFYGEVKDVRVYKTALSDAELTTLTTI